ncbi:hypothetical protein [Undibacterium sp. SXout20W]|uniref:hypothetical protein n=1 Tax=Undibacterium sp. SXout20W TaxID=3413051 RepID=UPI003BF29C29
MKILKLIGCIILGLFSVALVGLLCLLSIFKDEGKPSVVSSVDIVSPNHEWIATEEVIDNGLGFGQGMLFDEIHIHRLAENFHDHGDDDTSVVFYVDVAGDKGDPPKISWIDPTHMIITYEDSRHNKRSQPGKRIKVFRGIDIEYKNL